jgi:hypothetical protein
MYKAMSDGHIFKVSVIPGEMGKTDTYRAECSPLCPKCSGKRSISVPLHVYIEWENGFQYSPPPTKRRSAEGALAMSGLHAHRPMGTILQQAEEKDRERD